MPLEFARRRTGSSDCSTSELSVAVHLAASVEIALFDPVVNDEAGASAQDQTLNVAIFCSRTAVFVHFQIL